MQFPISIDFKREMALETKSFDESMCLALYYGILTRPTLAVTSEATAASGRSQSTLEFSVWDDVV